MLRVRTASTGYLGAPGLSTFYFSPSAETIGVAADVSARVRTFWDSIKVYYPTTVTMTVQPQVDVIDPATGFVTNSLIVAVPVLPVTGTGVASSALPPQVAALMTWKTSVFLEGRRLAGRTFISPLGGQVSAGQIPPGMQTGLQAAGVALLGPGAVSDVNLVVWRRPRPARSIPLPAQVARVGSVGQITVVAVPLKFATLNSRRD